MCAPTLRRYSHMHYRRFGRTGWKVSEIGYGMWGMAGWTGSEDKESLASLQRSVDLGCNFFDTAWAYGDGHSEQLLGKILRANQSNAAGGPDKKLYVATKVPPKNRHWPSCREFLSTFVFRPITSSSTSKKASRTLLSIHSISSSFTLGKTSGSTTTAYRAPSKTCAAAAKSAPWASASIAGNRQTESGLFAPDSSTPSRSSTTSSTKIPRTNYFPRAAKEMSLSLRAARSMKDRSPASSRSIALGQKAIGATHILSRKISSPAWPTPTLSSLFSKMA